MSVFDLDVVVLYMSVFFFQAEDGIRDLVRSRGLGDLYKRQEERIITSTQGPVIDTTVQREVLNFCANNYLGLSLSLIHI